MEKLKTLLQDVKPYNDFVATLMVALFAAHYILSHTTPYGFFEVVTVNGYWRSLLSSFIIALILVHAIRKITLALDNYIPYVRNWKLRTALQIVCGVLGIALVAISLAYGYFFLAAETKRFPRYLNHDFPIVLAFIIMVNAYYFIFFALRVNRKLYFVAANLAKRNQRDLESSRFKAALAEKTEDVTDNPIALIWRVERQYLAKYFDGTTAVWYHPIKTSIQELPAKDYFIINPKCIVHKMAIESIKPLGKKRYQLSINSSFEKLPDQEYFVVSQNKKLNFQQWFSERN